MFENRISQFFDVVEPQPAFVACPVPLFAAFTSAQQAFVAEVYRRAQELTNVQLRKPVRRTIPEFSLN